jgi:hypothetical protein
MDINDFLLFNGKKLVWKSRTDESDKHIDKYIWNYAISGLKKSNPHIQRLRAKGRTDIKPNTDYTSPKFQNLSQAGPIPEGKYRLKVTPKMEYEKSGGGWGIYPENPLIRKMGFLEGYLDEDIPWVRSGFFLHEDGGLDGTAGCIGLNRTGILNLKKYLTGYSGTGNSEIIILVDYKKL